MPDVSELPVSLVTRNGNASHNFGDTEYLRGSAGSLIIICTRCGEEHFRDFHYFFRPEIYRCFTCRHTLVPIRLDELESRWRPFWEHLHREYFAPIKASKGDWDGRELRQRLRSRHATGQ